jgi:CheY-like chemotaxis protein
VIRKASLLVVDDNEANRDALSRRLAVKGYQVTVAAGGEEALASVAGAVYDLVLLDVEMPGMSGFEVIAALRARWSATELPVIMVTAYGDADTCRRALECGAEGLLPKPIDFAALRAEVDRHLAWWRAGP